MTNTPLETTASRDRRRGRAAGSGNLDADTSRADPLVRNSRPRRCRTAVERSGTPRARRPAGTLRVHRPKGVDGPSRASIRSMAAAMSSGSYSMDDRCSTLCARSSAWWGCRSSIASLRNRSIPRRWTTAMPDCAGRTSTPTTLGSIVTRLGIGGVSAGGGLAAALALLAHGSRRGAGGVPAARLPHAGRPPGHALEPDRRAPGVESGVEHIRLAGVPRGSLRPRRRAVHRGTGRADDLSGLPPAFISVGSIDGFLDEDVDYAMRLNHAGVHAELHVYPGACHGYQMAQNSEIARQSRRDVETWLARRIRR